MSFKLFLANNFIILYLNVVGLIFVCPEDKLVRSLVNRTTAIFNSKNWMLLKSTNICIFLLEKNMVEGKTFCSTTFSSFPFLFMELLQDKNSLTVYKDFFNEGENYMVSSNKGENYMVSSNEGEIYMVSRRVYLRCRQHCGITEWWLLKTSTWWVKLKLRIM